MKVPCNCINFNEPCIKYYQTQAGNGDITPFRGIRYQRGEGLFGDIFRAAIPLFKPLLKRGASEIGKRLIKTGSRIFQDVSEGKSIRSAASSRLKEAGQEAINDLRDNLVQRGSGKKRKQRQVKRKQIKRVRYNDIFA